MQSCDTRRLEAESVMVALLSVGARGEAAPSPISPLVTTSSAALSPPHSPSRVVSPITPGLSSKPWVSSTNNSSGSSTPVTPPELVQDSGLSTPLDTPIPIIIPPRKDSFRPPPASSPAQVALESDTHVQRTASSYIARPLPEPPGASSLPTSSPVVLKPWMDDIENQSRPITPPRSMNSSPKYSLFPKASSTTHLPSSPPRSARPASPVKKQPTAPAPRSKFAGLFHRGPSEVAKPAMREHRSKTEPLIQPPPIIASQWTPRSSSLNRTQTAPVDSPVFSRPSASVPPPTLRRPSAADVIAAREVARGTQLKQGPGHPYQVELVAGPDIEGQKAVKWIKRSEKIKRKEVARDRAASTPDLSRAATRAMPVGIGPVQPPVELKIEIVEDTSNVGSPTISRPHPLRGLEKNQSEDWKAKELNDTMYQSQRGRTLQRTNTPSPLSLTTNDASSALTPPSAHWSLPPAKGPLDIRASTFNPFNPQLDTDAIDAFRALREAKGGSVALLPAPKHAMRDPSMANKQRQEEYRRSISRRLQSKHFVPQNSPPKGYREVQAQTSQPSPTRNQHHHRQHRRNKSDSSMSCSSPQFLQAKPLPPAPLAPVHLEPRPAVCRAQSPLAKLASLVR